MYQYSKSCPRNSLKNQSDDLGVRPSAAIDEDDAVPDGDEFQSFGVFGVVNEHGAEALVIAAHGAHLLVF